jgi:hypothetical protein
MPAGRPNVIDSHDCKLLIIRELLKKTSHAKISAKFGISIDALARYQKSELRRYIVNGVNLVDQERAVAQAESDKAVTDLVMDDITKIRGNGRTILDAVMKGMPENGQLDCDPKGFAVVARELRENARLQAQLEGRLQDRSATQVNVVILSAAPEHQAPHQAQIANPPVDDVLDAEWCEISPGA